MRKHTYIHTEIEVQIRLRTFKNDVTGSREASETYKPYGAFLLVEIIDCIIKNLIMVLNAN